MSCSRILADDIPDSQVPHDFPLRQKQRCHNIFLMMTGVTLDLKKQLTRFATSTSFGEGLLR